MATSVFTSTIASQLKDTLDGVLVDGEDGMDGSIWKEFVKEGNMPDNYLDDLEMGGPGLLSEKPEGAEIQPLAVNEGNLKRYNPRVMAGKLIITREAMDDGKYKEAIDMARFLRRSAALTVEYDWAVLLSRATNTSYPGGDNVPLASASHTLPAGGTFSNLLGTAAAPSRIAATNMIAQLQQYPGFDGLISPVRPKKLVCPVQQAGVWEQIFGSEKAPDAGNFAAINNLRTWKWGRPEVVPNPYWTATTTKWLMTTDAEKGFRHLWRKKPWTRTWVDNDHEVMKYSHQMRYAIGWTNARGICFSDA